VALLGGRFMSTDYVKPNFSGESFALTSLKASSKKSTLRTIPYRAVAPLAMIIDAVLIVSASVISGIAYHIVALGTTGDIAQFCGFAAIVAALFITLNNSRRLYDLSELLNLKSQIRQIGLSWIGVFLFLTAAAFVMKIGSEYSRGAVLLFAIFGLLILISVRSVWRIFLADGLAVRRFSGRKIALIAEQSPTGDVGLHGALLRHGLQPAYQFLLPANPENTRDRQQIIAEAISALRGSDIEEIVVSANLIHWPELFHVLSELRVLPLPVHLVPVGPLSELFKLSSRNIGDTVTIELQSGPLTLPERFVKRAIDIFVAAMAIIFLIPLFLIIALSIKLDSRGPIIFKQWRRGFNGRPFQILKFRTMSVLEDGDDVVQARPNDSRVTRVGNWLRRSSFDELPQFINVLQGSMSIVGPRPHAMAHDNEFDKFVRNYAYRHHVKPGMTGWAQVNGYRGQTRTIGDIEHRVKLDLWYIDNWNLAGDLRIMFMTLTELLRGANAY
jgi:Undecaprenyl-phosphate glucose phosphotransferase